MASPLMNMVTTAMPGYSSAYQESAFVRVGVCVASDPLPVGASSGHMGERFLAFLDRDPVAALATGLTYATDTARWTRHAGNGSPAP